MQSRDHTHEECRVLDEEVFGKRLTRSAGGLGPPKTRLAGGNRLGMRETWTSWSALRACRARRLTVGKARVVQLNGSREHGLVVIRRSALWRGRHVNDAKG